MAEEYERRGVLGEDGDLGEGGEVRDRGLFGGHHGHHGRRSELEYGRRPGLPYDAGAMAYGEPGYGRPYEGEAGYGRPGGMPYGEPGYGPPGAMPYGQPGYGPPGAMAYGEPGYGGMRRPEVVYVEGGGGRPEYYDGPGGGASDLGTGLIDSNIRTHPDYGSSLMRPDMAGVPIEAYERRGHHGHHDGYMEEEFDEERRRKRYAEAAAAATLGYGRHEKQDLEERLEELGYDSEGRPRRRQHHGLFRSDS